MKNIYSISLASIFMLLTSTALHAAAIAGTSTGVFIDPSGPSGMVTSGEGTPTFSWGNGAPFNSPPSSLSFTGNTFNSQTDQVFSFGTLTFFNGTVVSGTQANTVDLNVTLSFTAPSGINQDFSYNLGLINTPNTSNADASADIVQFQTIFPSTSFISGGIDYTLEFLGFGNITGSGFSTVNQFYVREGSTASASLLGRVTSVVSPVPEPETYFMLLAGLGLIGFIARRRNQGISMNFA